MQFIEKHVSSRAGFRHVEAPGQPLCGGPAWECFCSVGCSFPSVKKERMTIISINLNFSSFTYTIFIIIYVEYVKSSLNIELTTRCGGLQFLEALGQVPQLCPTLNPALVSSKCSRLLYTMRVSKESVDKFLQRVSTWFCGFVTILFENIPVRSPMSCSWFGTRASERKFTRGTKTDRHLAP